MTIFRRQVRAGRRLFLKGVGAAGFAAALPLAAALPARLSAQTSAPVTSAPVVVSSKLDIEGALLGQILLLTLSRANIPVEDRLLLGPTSIVRQALVSGAVDLYPEYTGNAAFFFNDDANPVWRDAKAGYERAAALDRAKNGLIWLKPAPADNNWVIALPRAFSQDKRITTLADLASFANKGGALRLAASAEFVESPAGLPAFEAAYGFKLRADQLLVLSGGETSATCKAAADGISGVNAAMAYGTDGALIALDLVALDDNKHVEPVYAPCPVIRESVLALYPRIADLLAPVFARLDLETLRRLNAKIAVDGEDARTVAADFLSLQG